MILLRINLRNIIPVLLLSASLLFVISCRTMDIKGVSSITVKVPEGINLTEDDFLSLFPKSYYSDKGYLMVIVPYSYSPFVEITAFSGSEIISKKNPGEMEVLVRIMDKGKIVKVFFIEAEEEGKENLLRVFSGKVKQVIPGGN